jgi:hypothetical protein
MEAEMPEGFPQPTPVGEVEVKQYPAYRMARSDAGESSAFWNLFEHIKREEIAMTAPVEMSYRETETGDRREKTMAFLYGSRDLGQTGREGPVSVVDVPPKTVVSIGVRGDRSEATVQSAREHLVNWIEANSARYQPAGEMRVMGYNSPFLPARRRFFEVQIPVTVAGPSTAEQDRPGEFELSDHVWKNRVLLAFAPSRADEAYALLRDEWGAQGDGVADRDLLLVEVFEQGESRAGDVGLPASTAAELRSQFQVEPGVSTFILIGKDGTVKLRRGQVRLSDLFPVIDAMPMRRAEMLRR